MADAHIKIYLTSLLLEIRPDVLPVTPKHSGWILNGSLRHPLGRRNWKSQKPLIKTTLIIFSTPTPQCTKKIVSEGTLTAGFYKAAIHCLLNGIQRVPPAAFCCRDFFSCCYRPPQHRVLLVSLCLKANAETIPNIPRCHYKLLMWPSGRKLSSNCIHAN
jgi:hypothetical protein